MSRIRILVFGDSIAWGRVDNVAGGWVNRLQAQYTHSNPDQEVQFYNLGVPGGRLEDTLARIKTESEARNPQVVILAVGINDALDGLDKSKFTRLYKEIYRQVAGKKVFSLGLIRANKLNTEGSQANQEIEVYDALIRQVASELELPFIDVSKIFDGSDYVPDDLHPNARGHAKLAAVIKQALTKAGVL
ncbi:SGNH/GDSL hydrolase family protein [Candidatus Microgenomates bacterium]|nr:SGNH/GDSL hydrolase family protein [Candidatus Microgenomates bacterium]